MFSLGLGLIGEGGINKNLSPLTSYFHSTSKDLSLINKSNSIEISYRLKKIRVDYTGRENVSLDALKKKPEKQRKKTHYHFSGISFKLILFIPKGSKITQ